jgi:hypothetical protein
MKKITTLCLLPFALNGYTQTTSQLPSLPGVKLTNADVRNGAAVTPQQTATQLAMSIAPIKNDKLK